MNIVLLPAFPFDHRMWLAVAEDLSQDGHEIALPDIRGLGEAPDWEEHEPATLTTLARDVIRMLDALQIDKAVLGGCSLGGYISLEVLRQFPERVQGLILVDTKASADREEQRVARQDRIKEVKATQSLDGILGGIENRMLAPDSLDDAEVMKLFHDMLMDVRIDGVCHLLDAMSKREAYVDELQKTDIPILSLRGESDSVSTREDHELLVQSAVSSKHVEIHKAGHLAPLEQPVEVANAIREFLRSF